jgi:multidrug efflux pump subunit AcrA (membrane-fusion protein)
MWSSQPRFRADLEIVRDNDADPAVSNVTIVDPRSGERHIFTTDEYLLCRAIDGSNTLAAVRQAFKVETRREISHGNVFKFFRHLRSLGLLEGGKPAAVIAPHPGEAASTSIAQDGPSAIMTLERDRVAVAAKQPATNVREASAAGIAQSTPLPAEPTIVASAEPAPAAPSDPGEKLDLPVAAMPDEAGKPDAAQGFSDDFKELEFLGPLEGSKAEGPAARSGGLRGKGRGAGRSEAGGARTAGAVVRRSGGTASSAGPGEPGDFDDLEAAFDEMGPDGSRPKLGEGPGGRSRRDGAQVLLAGLAARARARQGSEATAKEPARVFLFNPNTVLGIIAARTRPLKYIFVPLLLLAAATVWIAYQYRDVLAQDISGFDLSAVATVILGLVITNLICRITQATFIRAFGGPVKQFGIALMFGIPRFFVDLGGIVTLGRRGQLWVYAAPLIARIGLFCGGTLLWFAFRSSSLPLAHLALVVGQIGLLTFLLSALPLLPADGYRWLATYFGRPELRSDALRAIAGRASEAADDEALRSMPKLDAADDDDAAIRESSAVTLYVLGVALAVSMLALVAQAYFDVATTGNVGLPTAALLFGVGIALAAWIIALWKYVRGTEIEVLDPAATQRLLTNWTGQADLSSDRPVSIGTVGKVFWAVVLCVLLAVAFLPYRYQAGGKFEILPAERTIVSVRTSGELKQVLVHDGDWVKANQVLAKLSSDDQERAITITNAELQHATAQLAQFGGGMTTSAESGLEQSIADAFSDDPDAASAKKAQTAANYTRTQAERVARAEVERLTRKLAFERDQLRQTDVRAPKEGRVVTPNVHLLTGIWLRQGAKLLVLDDTRTLEAEVNIPEADIAAVKVGDKVRLRPWSNDDREIAGRVTEITPTAQPTSYGMVVRVRVAIPSSEDFLRPAMTGYAKIDGPDMRVWEAFLRRIIRIVRVEMWSWIP